MSADPESFTEQALNTIYVEKGIAKIREFLPAETCSKEVLKILTLAYHFAVFRHENEFRDFVIKVCSPLPECIRDALEPIR
ncbi:MAG TPA: hypothetical protein DDZ88_19615 [Verrucomicrobiales bacterium]|nr:hypothetical protein [Verrucomicrobiales bacterium]